ncbi:hypothetical protein HOD30_05140 [Candidatus Peregrinibacteria bacterium]|jgi:hypothetical protein|nr:hypothetical protein [Candidatus Peregrinibacteria bacterium]MBT4631409.1 hypothetical protein [Candidatus Peregrinibacteria bacterium]MBT5517100.1 hypothetical protein [Candidatus Peregrinibacteria bacterium]MBT5824006.1 hypothetical protein [Candidatus Peregrinibacteria bacterium]
MKKTLSLSIILSMLLVPTIAFASFCEDGTVEERISCLSGGTRSAINLLRSEISSLSDRISILEGGEIIEPDENLLFEFSEYSPESIDLSSMDYGARLADFRITAPSNSSAKIHQVVLEVASDPGDVGMESFGRCDGAYFNYVVDVSLPYSDGYLSLYEIPNLTNEEASCSYDESGRITYLVLDFDDLFLAKGESIRFPVTVDSFSELPEPGATLQIGHTNSSVSVQTLWSDKTGNVYGHDNIDGLPLWGALHEAL